MATITLDGTEYDSENISDEAKNQVASLQFVKNEIVNIAFERGWVKTAEQRNIEAQKEMESKES